METVLKCVNVFHISSNQTVSYLKSPCEKFVLHLQVVSFIHFGLKRLVEDGIPWVILNVLPAGIAMSDKQLLRIRRYRN